MRLIKIGKISFYSICLVLFFLPITTQANHIIGGQMSYKHVAGDTYSFNLEMFRDCNSGGATLDQSVAIAVYAEYIDAMILVSDNSISGLVIDSFTAINDECNAQGSTLCLEKGSYKFELELKPEINVIAYHIVYQRCCRSNTYENLVQSTESGFTIPLRITSKALELNNSGPELTSNLHFETCVGSNFSTSLASSDSDGDQITYELVSPQIGGGLAGSGSTPGNSTDCDGVTPQPACPPPYDVIKFLEPNFTFDKPLGPMSNFDLDLDTGTLETTPSISGNFLAGMSINEYRDGELLSTTYQDLNFRVLFSTGLENLSFSQLDIYPNPAKEELTINLPKQSTDYQLRIFDVQGKTIFELNQILGEKINLNVSHLQGLYFVEIISKTEIYLEKILINE